MSMQLPLYLRPAKAGIRRQTWDSRKRSQPQAGQRSSARFWLSVGCLLQLLGGSAVGAEGKAPFGFGLPELLSPLPPIEQEPPPAGYLPDGTTSKDRLAEARVLFSFGRYADAAAVLKQIVTIDPKPLHIFNLAQSQRRAGQLAEATRSYRRFLDEAPQHPSIPEAKAYLAELAALATASEQAAQSAQQLDKTRSELLSERAEADKLRRQRPIYKRAWFWITLGGVVTAGVVAGAVGGALATRQPTPPPTDTGYVGFTF